MTRAHDIREQTIPSEAELRRAYQAVLSALGAKDAMIQPSSGKAGMLQQLVWRGEAFLRRNPHHQKAITRVAVLRRQLAEHEKAVDEAWQHLFRLCREYEARQGFTCSQSADCWLDAARRGHVCVLERVAVEALGDGQ